MGDQDFRPKSKIFFLSDVGFRAWPSGVWALNPKPPVVWGLCYKGVWGITV